MAETSEERPLLCVVDDAQWLDQASAQVLGFVGRRLLAESIALVFAARTPTRPRELPRRITWPGLPELRLGGLDDEPARALLATVTSGPLDESVRARIIEETHGNPLALLELCRGLGAAELAGGFALPDAGDLPQRIEDQYLERLGELPEEAQRLVLLAAADPVGDSALILRAAQVLGLDIGAIELRRGGRAAGYRRERALPASAGAFGRLPGRRGRGSASRPRRAGRGDRSGGRPRPPGVASRARHGRAGRGGGRGAHQLRRAGPCAGAGWPRPPPSGSAPWRSPRTRASAPRGRSRRPRRSTRPGISKPRRPCWSRRRSDRSASSAGAHVQQMRAQIAFALRRGSDAPPLLLRAAQRLQTLDAELARQTYLEALVAAIYAGRLAHGQDTEEIARAAQIRSPSGLGSEPLPHPQLLLRGLAVRLTDGYAAAAPTLKEALRRTVRSRRS